MLLPEDGGLVVKAGFPLEDMLDAAARWCFEKNQATGCGADALPGAKRRFMPLRTGRGTVGVAEIDSDKPGLLLTPEELWLLDALSDQAALAINRVNLTQYIDRARLAAETKDGRLLGTIHLKDIIKGGIRERFERLIATFEEAFDFVPEWPPNSHSEVPACGLMVSLDTGSSD